MIDLERLAEPGRVGPRTGCRSARRGARAVARAESSARSRRTRACGSSGLPTPGHASPRQPAGRSPEPEEHAAAGEEVERRDGRRRCRRRAGGHLHDRRAQPDPLGAAADPRERRDSVRAVRLRRPDGVEAAALRLLGEPDPEPGVVVPQLQPEAHAGILVGMTDSLFPPDTSRRVVATAPSWISTSTRTRPRSAARTTPPVALVEELRGRAREAGLWAPHVRPRRAAPGPASSTTPA